MKKLLSTTLAVGIFSAMTSIPSFAMIDAGTLPNIHTQSNAEVTEGGSNNLNVKVGGGQQGAVGTLDWYNFNIGKEASVNFEFTNHNQTALNRVEQAGGISQLYGKITSSSTGCDGCGYDATGKIILINPNGILFGENSSVNVNSFTASTLDGVYNNDSKQITFTKGANQGTYGIVVEKGANIHGSKGVTLVSNNIYAYAGSKISTDVAPNVGDTSYGKIKLITADGVNFTYYNNGAIKEIGDKVNSSDKMILSVNGTLESGNIDIRNYSTNSASDLNLNGATLKATKAVNGSDGNIWLTASNTVTAEDTKFITANYSEGAAPVDGGNVKILSGNKTSLSGVTVNAVGNVDVESENNDVIVADSAITADKNFTAKAGNKAAVEDSSSISAKDITVKGKVRGQILDSTANGDNITVEGENAWIKGASLKAKKDITLKGTKGYVMADSSSAAADGKITLDAATNVTSNGTLDVKSSQTNIKAGDTININLANVDNREKGLVAEAENDVTISTDGTLSVSSLISRNGNMTLNADKVIAGKPYTKNDKIPGDDSDRSYIYVANGKFTSNTKHDHFDVTASDTPVQNGQYNQRHHIQYGDGKEKILLINNRPAVQQQTNFDNAITMDNDNSQMLNKLPRQPELFNNQTTINDTRTSFIDVFAAASQIEIDEEDEE